MVVVHNWVQGLGSAPDVPHADYVSDRKTEGNGVGINKEPPVSVNGLDDRATVGVELVDSSSTGSVTRLSFSVSLVDVRVKWDTLLVSNTLVVEMPPGSLPEGSKESFVMLLDHAEQVLGCRKVIVSFNKSRTDRVTLIRTFMFLGFVLVAPGTHQLPVSSESIYMSYSINDDDDDNDGDESELDSEGESGTSR